MARDTQTSQSKSPAEDELQEPTCHSDTAAPTGRDARDDGLADAQARQENLRQPPTECAEITGESAAEVSLCPGTEAGAAHVPVHQWLYDAYSDEGLREFFLPEEIPIDTDLVSFLLDPAKRDLNEPLKLAGSRFAVRQTQDIIEREKAHGGLLTKVKAVGGISMALRGRTRACPTSLSERDSTTMPQLRHITANQEDIMPRNSNMPERDERGRFMSDDDYAGRGSDRNDDRDRDSRGRFMRERDNGRYSSRRNDDNDDRRYASSRRYDEDRRSYSRGRDDDYSQDRGQGGWFGDHEGHAEAARRGWDHRRDDDDDRYGSRGRSSRRDDYDDDDRRYASSRRYDDGRQNYSRGRDDDYSRDRGQGGWFGDPEGHAEAARRGWDHRRDDDDRYGSRGRR